MSRYPPSFIRRLGVRLKADCLRERMRMKGFVKLVDGLDRLVKVLVVLMFFVSLATIVGSVICRSLLHIAVPWSEEVAKYLTVYIVYWAAALAARTGRLTRLTVAVDALHLNHTGQRIVEWMVGLIAIGFYALAGYATIRAIELAATQFSPALKIPMWIPYLGIPIGCVLLILNTFANLLDPEAVDEIEGGVSE